MEESDRIAVGKIAKPVGLKGEVKVVPWTDFPERFAKRGRVFARKKGEPEIELEIVRARGHSRAILLQFAGICTLEAADRLREAELFIPRQEAMPLPEGTYYTFELIGLEVVTEEGERLGRLSDVWSMPAQDVYVVDREGKEILVPALRSIIRDVDLPRQRMTVNLPDGLLEIYTCR
ncbi:MAG: 16S rRNA processing protein RimM [Candidatus Latescibacteria bacterium]|nr:16S rRNA processing protein RimM [Candidatus Latescibacterota bacterium]MCK5526740.1 16S rRNA processing protein RimM [Candidatus Latescibacterota bacterium]MCK5732786.1 16S rRNA processing protein RimM [Candidatus Latescibacterota bacterium]